MLARQKELLERARLLAGGAGAGGDGGSALRRAQARAVSRREREIRDVVTNSGPRLRPDMMKAERELGHAMELARNRLRELQEEAREEVVPMRQVPPSDRLVPSARLEALRAKESNYRVAIEKLRSSESKILSDDLPTGVTAEALFKQEVETNVSGYEEALKVALESRAKALAARRTALAALREHREINEALRKKTAAGGAGAASDRAAGSEQSATSSEDIELARIKELRDEKQRISEHQDYLMDELIDFCERFYAADNQDVWLGQTGAGVVKRQKRRGREGARGGKRSRGQRRLKLRGGRDDDDSDYDDDEDGNGRRGNDAEDAEHVDLFTLVLRLMSKCIRSPESPYMDVSKSMWKPHVELLVRAGVAVKHPSNSNALRLERFHR